MCHHHRAAITAAARNTAPPEQAHQARAHLAACTTCRRLHHRLQHQAEQHQRHHAITAVLPASALGLLHRLVGWAARRPTLPSGSGERAAQFAAGGGLAKAAAATTAVIAATATITNGLHTHHPPPPAPSRDPGARVIHLCVDACRRSTSTRNHCCGGEPHASGHTRRHLDPGARAHSRITALSGRTRVHARERNNDPIPTDVNPSYQHDECRAADCPGPGWSPNGLAGVRPAGSVAAQ